MLSAPAIPGNRQLQQPAHQPIHQPQNMQQAALRPQEITGQFEPSHSSPRLLVDPQPVRRQPTIHGQPRPSLNQEESIFQILTSHRALRHLRLFIRPPSNLWPRWRLSVTDAIYTFLCYRLEKLGCRLQSLVVHSHQPNHMASCSWTVFELGEDKVCVSDEPSQQVWDVSDYEHLKLVQEPRMRFAGYHDRIRQLKAENGFRIPTEWLET